MGMYSILWPISPDVYKQILEHPSLISYGILGEEAVANTDELDTLKPFLPEFRAAIEKSGLDLERHWEGIHTLLSGSPDPDSRPISWAILGGKEIDTTMGDAARVLDPQAVQAVASAIEKISSTQFTERLDREKIKDPERYADAGTNEKEMKLYTQLRELYIKTAKDGWAMLLYLA